MTPRTCAPLLLSLSLTSGLIACGDADEHSPDAHAWGTTELQQAPSDEPVVSGTDAPVLEPPPRYEMRDGMPVPVRETSFVHIAHTSNKACVIDEFAQLLCWTLDSFNSPAPDIAFIEPIAADVLEVALNYNSLCIIHGADTRQLSCLDGNARFEPVFSDEDTRNISDISMKYSRTICALDSGRLTCANFSIDEQSGALQSSPLAFHERHRTLYHTFNLADLPTSRIQSHCAVDTRNQVQCWAGFSDVLENGRGQGHLITTSPLTGQIQDMRYTQFGVAALLAGERIELLRFDPWGYEDVAFTGRDIVPGKYSALYSSRCAQSVEGPVVCWDDLTQPATVLIEQAPRALGINDGLACGITTSGDVFCQEHPY